MKLKNLFLFAAASLALPGAAHAGLILDSGVPASSSVYVLNSASWFAGEFNVTTGETITSLAAYLTQGAGNVGDTFTFDIYADSGFTSRPSSRPAAVYTATGTFTANGWNATNVSWSPLAAGNYWLALQVSSSAQTKGLDLPGELSATTGSLPALAFAYAGTSGQYSLSGAPAIGLQVNAVPSAVPLPAAGLLLASGLAGLGGMARRRSRKAA